MFCFIFVILLFFFFFFFQAEDGIRYHCVTGVQTCALPILYCLYMHKVSPCIAHLSFHTSTPSLSSGLLLLFGRRALDKTLASVSFAKIGRASCRERV